MATIATYQTKIDQLLKSTVEDRSQELIDNADGWCAALRLGKIEPDDFYKLIWLSGCNHPVEEIVYYHDSTGRKRFQHECRICGHTGNEISVKDWPAFKLQQVPKRRVEQRNLFGVTLRNIYNPVLEEIRRSEFDAYYKTEAWEKKRNLVLDRDDFTCQICFGRATIAHHLTYAHFQNEYLFELVSLCPKCHHDAYHADKPR